MLLNKIYSRKIRVYDTTSVNNTHNYISLKNRNNNFNIHSLNDRIYFYNSCFKTEGSWNKAAVSIFNLVNENLDSYLTLLKNNPTTHTIKTCDVWAYIHLLNIQNK